MKLLLDALRTDGVLHEIDATDSTVALARALEVVKRLKTETAAVTTETPPANGTLPVLAQKVIARGVAACCAM